MVQVINGEITRHKLPKTGTLQSGETVSGYHLLDREILIQEGWLPLEADEPTYDAETQYITADGYEILADKVIKKYKVLPITPNISERLKSVEDVLLMILQEA